MVNALFSGARVPLSALKYFLRQACSKHTSASPDFWTEENPLFGHCAVAALIVQDFMGGHIERRLFPKEWRQRLGSRSHYWNVLDGGREEDFSRSQFPDDFPYDDFVSGKIGESVNLTDNRDYILSFPETNTRYRKLCESLQALLDSNPLFQDEIFLRSWELAFSGKTVCPKMRFACLVYDGDKLIAQDVNRNFVEGFGMERLCSFDGRFCIRMDLGYRVDPVLGDCGHAPIWCMKKVFSLGYKPEDLVRLDFYEGGFFPDGSPWWRQEPDYTCALCENLFAVFGLDKIYGAFNGAWHPFWTEESLYTSVRYASGEKEV